MPTYDYDCENCGNHLEALQKITAEPLVECPQCRKPALKRRPGGGIGLAFQGSGFYSTDYGSAPSSQDKGAGAGGCCPCGKNQGSCGTNPKE